MVLFYIFKKTSLILNKQTCLKLKKNIKIYIDNEKAKQLKYIKGLEDQNEKEIQEIAIIRDCLANHMSANYILAKESLVNNIDEPNKNKYIASSLIFSLRNTVTILWLVKKGVEGSINIVNKNI